MSIDKVAYWRGLALYDMETAEAMYAAKRWLYVGFMCHQVAEKILKAYWSKIKPDDVPFIHNLLKLAQSTGLVSIMNEEQKDLLSTLMPMNIEARYPDYKQSLASIMDDASSRELIHNTKQFLQWIENML